MMTVVSVFSKDICMANLFKQCTKIVSSKVIFNIYIYIYLTWSKYME